MQDFKNLFIVFIKRHKKSKSKNQYNVINDFKRYRYNTSIIIFLKLLI